VVLHCAAGPLIRRDVRPCGRERLDIWIVHAEDRKVGQGIEVAQARPPQF
jgi:hypothetical protein